MSGVLNMLVGKKLSPEEQVKKWRSDMRQQERELERRIRSIDSEEAKVKRDIKAAAKRGDKTSCMTLAKEVVNARKAKERMYTSKAQMNSIIMQLQQQVAMIKVAGNIQKSAELMKLVNKLIKVPEMSKNMQEMQREMMKAGIIEEMMNDAIDMADDEGIDDESEEIVDKVLLELTDGLLGQAGSVKQDMENPTEETEELGDKSMEVRFEALKAT
ncbi:hypothetical protein SeMB42_g01319 [Synchytrium endobioticum]|uniref:Charged multivesicular body protein 3 n=1 Tax=Synchytrium endobioticum TaxID=286115 RepID=A0A507DEA3_9FUNG|nr:hypothetical protein SeLEV6574_g01600 [Synchytrium endobioticum]TPX52568.1 hypothetical protein SeMB42_g01319 [Synchytrium endobioticum]